MFNHKRRKFLRECYTAVVTIQVASNHQAIQLFSTVLVPIQEPMVLVPISAMSRPIYMLTDAALDPLYS